MLENVKIDGKKIIENLKKDSPKPYSFSLSPKTMEAFKKELKGVSASQVVEKLIQEFLKSLKK